MRAGTKTNFNTLITILILSYLFASFIWGFSSFFKTKELLPEKIRDMSFEIRQEMQTQRMIQDGSIWAYWAMLLVWKAFRFVLYGALFPYFYFKFMYSGDKELQETKSHLESLLQIS